MQLTRAAIVTEVRRLATEHPTTVYQRTGAGCSYVAGASCPDEQGCIVGVAILNLDGSYPTAELLQLASLGSGLRANHLLHWIPGTTEEALWVACVQRNQDSRKTWGEALALADKDYPLT